MTSLQGPGRQNSPEPFADLLARLEQMRRELGDLTSSVLKSAGIRVSDQGMTIQSALDVDGSLDVSGPATVSGSLDVSGPATFSGNTTIGGDAAITGTLSLPAGIINNDALANPVVFDGVESNEYGFPITTTPTDRASVNFVVPPGFTQMSFTFIADATISNPTASNQYVYLRAYREMPGGALHWASWSQVTLAPGYWGSVMCPYIYQTAVTPGSTIRFFIRVWASADLAADPDHWTGASVAVSLTR